MAQIEISPKRVSLPLAGSAPLDVEAELARFEAEERARLGLEPPSQWVEDMADLGFTKSQRASITLLVGGLTMAHDYLVEAALGGIGYEVLALDCPDDDALRVGKEFGNRGQCNPTYFTVGNLVKFLIHLRDDKGMSTHDIVQKFVFLTAGACGPCRFGMYVTEYRKALRDAGFDGFRVMLFQQQGGLSQATGEASGLELNPTFFAALVRALVAGDVLNAVGYRIRPYEVEPGATDRALAVAKKTVYDALRARRSALFALLSARSTLAAVRVDRTRVKPRVAIIGEFWAMTTEGAGNYQLQRFLESEGAECDIQLVTAWILYNVWEVKFDTASRAELREADHAKNGLADLDEQGLMLRRVGLWAADKAVRVVFHTFAWCGGLHDYHLPDMDEVARVAHSHYDNDLRGGEGHMEVGKLILNVVKQKATMTLSVKPFGCMPSGSVSDGVQSLITEKYPGTIFCAVETSGDGAVNFYSRVQMYLFKAKQAALAEAERELAQSGLAWSDVHSELARRPALAHALHRAPHAGGCTTTDLVHEVALARRPLPVKARAAARTVAVHLAALGQRALTDGPAQALRASQLGLRAARELAELAGEKGPELRRAAVASARARLARVVPFASANA